jgi:hypothetical protein
MVSDLPVIYKNFENFLKQQGCILLEKELSESFGDLCILYSTGDILIRIVQDRNQMGILLGNRFYTYRDTARINYIHLSEIYKYISRNDSTFDPNYYDMICRDGYFETNYIINNWNALFEICHDKKFHEYFKSCKQVK